VFVQTELWGDDPGSLALECDTAYDGRQAADPGVERGIVDLKWVEEHESSARVVEGGRDGSPKAEFATQRDPVAGLPDLRAFQVIEEALLKDSNAG
jgi:hypothetical protein